MPSFIPRFAVVCLALACASGGCYAQTYTTAESIIYSFPTALVQPSTSFIQASDGSFYWTSSTAIYKYVPTLPGFPAPQNPLSTLHTASGSATDPGGYSGMIEGPDGNFYGVATGGANGYGQIFKLTPSGTFTTFYSFCSVSLCADGETPVGPMTLWTDGNFYGVTSYGGKPGTTTYPNGPGTIFRLTTKGVLTTIYKFCTVDDCYDGAVPMGGMNPYKGYLWGTASQGASSYPAHGGGTIFQFSPEANPVQFITPEFIFCGNDDCDGTTPFGTFQPPEVTFVANADSGTLGGIYDAGIFCDDKSGCVTGPASNLLGAYATANGGTNGYGAFITFEFYISTLPQIYAFCAQAACADGAGPGSFVQGNDGAFYGTVSGGAANGAGGIFRLNFSVYEEYIGTTVPVPPVNITPSSVNLLTGQPANLSWQLEGGPAAYCHAALNGVSYGEVPTSGTYSFMPPSPGTYLASITCGGFETGYSVITVTNAPASTAIALSTSTPTVSPGATVSLTAQVSKTGNATGVPAGNVTFKYGRETLGTASLDRTGTASFAESTTGINPGTYPITAVYDGDAGDSTSTSTPVSITVTGLSSQTTVAAYPNPIPANQEVQLTATVTGSTSSPTGTVTFSYQGTALATVKVASSGNRTSTAQYIASTNGLPAGSYTATATYSGNALYSPSSGTVSVTLR